MKSLWRVIPYVQGAFPRLFLGVFIALAAAATALTIPLALRWLVDNPLSSGDIAQIIPGVAVIFTLGMAEVIFIYLRRWLTLGPGVHLEGAGPLAEGARDPGRQLRRKRQGGRPPHPDRLEKPNQNK